MTKTQDIMNLKNSVIDILQNNEINVISFDIFDTLVYRPFVKPSDLFKYIEKSYNAKGFFKARKRAELKARIALQKEVDFDEIYTFMPYNFRHFKEIEKMLEFQMLKTNNKIFEIYKYAKDNGYKIIAISDMYFNKDFLNEVLRKCGYFIDEIYVSNEYNTTKSKGDLYDFVIKSLINRELISNSKEILHIGDNYQSDYRKAKKKGLFAINITTVYEDLFQRHKFLKRFFLMTNKSLSSSLIIANIANNNCNDFLYNFGYNIVSILSLVYASFILTESRKKNIEQLLFVARDGYFIKKVMDVLLKDADIESSYVYAPRKQFLLTHYVEDSGVAGKILMPQNFCNLVIDSFDIDSKGINAYKFYKRHPEIIKIEMEELRKKYNYSEYIKRIVRKKRVAVVDGMTLSLRAQKLVSMELNSNVFGFYIVSFSGWIGSNKEYKIDRLVKHFYQNIYLTKDIACMIERIFQSPEETAYFVNSDGDVIFKEPFTKGRREIYAKIEQGVLDSINNLGGFLNDSIVQMFANSNLFLKLLATFRVFDKRNFRKAERMLYVEFLAEEEKEKNANK